MNTKGSPLSDFTHGDGNINHISTKTKKTVIELLHHVSKSERQISHDTDRGTIRRIKIELFCILGVAIAGYHRELIG